MSDTPPPAPRRFAFLQRSPPWFALVFALLLLQICQGNRLADNFEDLARQVDDLRRQIEAAPPAVGSAPGPSTDSPDSAIALTVNGAPGRSPESLRRADLLAGTGPGSLLPAWHPAHDGTGNERVPPLQVGSRGGTLRAALRTDVDCFNPITSKSLVTFGALLLVFDPLFQIDPFEQVLLPRLAVGYEASEDLTEWIIHLRPGVQWADGHPFTADDVIFTFEVVRRPDVVSYSSQEFDYEVDGERIPVTAEKIDDLTVRFRQPLPYAAFREKLANRAVVPAHLLRPVAEDGRFQRHWGVGTDDFSEHVGTGPFRIAAHRKGQQLTLERNPLYWGRDRDGRALPYLDRVVLDVLETPDVRFFRFQSGELDLLGDVPGDLVPILRDLEERPGSEVRVFDIGTEVGWSYLVFNQNTGTDADGAPLVEPHKLAWFRDRRFRQACSHAIDRATIAENVYGGLAQPCRSPFPRASGIFHNPATPFCAHDPARAGALLDDMGLSDRDGDGVREDESGRPLEFGITYYERSPELVAVVGMAADALEALGMKVHRQRVDRTRLVSSIFERCDFEAIISEDSGGAGWPSGDHPMWSSTAEYHVWFPRQESPSTAWEAEIDEIFREASREPDRSRALKSLYRFQEIAGREQPLVLLCSKTRSMARRANLRNYRPGPTEPSVLWCAAEMFFAEE